MTHKASAGAQVKIESHVLKIAPGHTAQEVLDCINYDPAKWKCEVKGDEIHVTPAHEARPSAGFFMGEANG